MPSPQLSFTKVVFPPTSTAGVHTYTAGSFFAVLSLKSPQQSNQHDIHILGKQIFEQLEREFFSLEEKNLASIKHVIQETIKELPHTLSLSFSAAYIREGIMYVFVVGSGSIFIKRDTVLAPILEIKETSDTPNSTLKAASGHIQAGDIIFLATSDFSQHISSKTLHQISDRLPNEMADTLTGRLQTVDNSTTASIIIKVEGLQTPSMQYHSPETQPHLLEEAKELDNIQPVSNLPLFPSSHPSLDTKSEESEEVDGSYEEPNKRFTLPSIKFKLPSLPKFLPNNIFTFSARTKIGFVIALVIIAIFAFSIHYIQVQQSSVRSEKIFHQYYDEAMKHYDNGNGIASVNPVSSSSQQEYQKAASLLQTAQKQLPANSAEMQQVNDLLAKVNDKLSTRVQTVQDAPAKDSDSPLLAFEKKQTDAKYVGQDDKDLYYITDKGIFKDGTSKALVANDKDWSMLGGFGTYYGNFYVLDTSSGIIKYVAAGSGYGKTTYFANDTHPKVTNAVSLAIDSSIYILTSDGLVTKYTKGEPDSFSLKGWDKPLSSPTRIFTTADDESVYILDNGNSRIVKAAKDGTFQAQYANEDLAKGKDIDVHESDKKIFFLTDKGIMSIDM